ncbi:hypothetical protein Tco_0540425 [Tanacetum coccineum]
MGSITDIKSALTQRALQIFCETYHIPDEVHPELPNPNQTIHEMPTGKIGVYTRFFQYANFRLLLSTFLVDVLRYYHIHISQLSVIGAAKVSHFEVLCRVHGFEPTVGLFRCFYVNSKNKGWMSFSKRLGNDAVCYTKPLDSLKNWNDRFFWVDSFACPASFPWSTSKGISKYPEPFLCLVGISRYYTLDVDTYPEFLCDGEMDLLSFIRTADPMKVRVGERQRADEEPQLLETTVGPVVLLLPVAPARTSGELEASVEKLFGEGDGGEQVEQGDSAGGGQGVDIQPVIAAADTIVEDVAPLQPMRRKKRKTVAVDASGPSHPPKKLREDYGDPSGPSVAGKPRSAVQRLLAGAVLNAEVRGEPILTLPFVTSSVSATPERENENPADSVTGLSSTPIIATVVTATVDAAATAKETPVRPSLFGAGSSSAGGIDPTPGGFSNVSGSDFLIGGIRTVVEPNFDLQKDDSIPEEHVLLSDDEDSENDHQPKADVIKDWWKPLPEEERPATPEHACTIPSSNKYDNFLEMALPLSEQDYATLTQAYFKGQAYEVVKAFYLDVIHLQFQMEECHKMLTPQVDWTDPEGDHVRIDVNRPLPLGGPPGHITIQP